MENLVLISIEEANLSEDFYGDVVIEYKHKPYPLAKHVGDMVYDVGTIVGNEFFPRTSEVGISLIYVAKVGILIRYK